MSAQPSLSRELVFIKLTELNLDPQELTIHALAFVPDAGPEPEEEDFEEAIITTKDGEPALALMIGPTRGDTVETLHLSDDDYQVWVDASENTTGERVVRPCGVHSINPRGVAS